MRDAIGALTFAALALAAPAALAGQRELLMVEQPGCIYCAQWNAEIGPIYPRSAEGAAAPLRRVQLRDPLPDGVTVERPVVFTPTFVLIDDGREIGRIEGYPGEHFFWPLLADLLRENSAP